MPDAGHPALLPALSLVARLHRSVREGRDDPEARAAIGAAMRRLGDEDRRCVETVARGFCGRPNWYLPITGVAILNPNEVEAGPSWTDIAAAAYRAYAVSTGGKNFRGDPMPKWEELPQPIRTAWEAAVRHADDFSANPSSDEQRWSGWAPPDKRTA